MALNEKQEAGLLELLAAFENGKRIADLEPAQGEPGAMRIEVMDASGETRSMELERAVAEAGNPIAGRWWDNTTGTPTAGGWWGSVEALRNLPQTLGLGRYLVTDDRQMRKLDPGDSHRFADGSPAALDGSMGQCMWCWSRPWYFTEIVTVDRTYWAITLKPLEGYKSQRIPAGGTSWLGAGVVDRTEMKLCSLISDEERYRGGAGKSIAMGNEGSVPLPDSPQSTMLGMPATMICMNDFSDYARKRGEGWEANWFVAQAAVQILVAVIMGTRDIQAAYVQEKDNDGLYQGGFGRGVTTMYGMRWDTYNKRFPLIPTNVGAEMGDKVGLVEYRLPEIDESEGSDATNITFGVPCFFGLMHAGFGHLWRLTAGVSVYAHYPTGMRSVYVSGSMGASCDVNHVDEMLKVSECPAGEAWIKRVSTEGLCMVPTDVGGSPSLYYADYFTSCNMGPHAKAAGGCSDCGIQQGVFATTAEYPSGVPYSECTSPLCFFIEDPKV
ncbi:MAG: hypothetical protein UH625_03670 [Muribaculaceae bacterium]|nr:hypothetical protein [Muribaculaceae bacterium]